MADDSVGAAVDEAGAPSGGNPGDAPLSLDTVRAWCERDERTLRMQGPLPPRAERELRSPDLDPATMDGALRRWKYLGHVYLCRSERLVDAEPPEEAARKLLRREPVRLRIGGHPVEVTGRSYDALAEIAQHARRIQDLEQALRETVQHERECLAQIAAAPGWKGRRERRRAQRHYRRLGVAHRAFVAEMQLHRTAIYANIATPNGEAARGLEDAPVWAKFVGPLEDAALMIAVHGVGAARLDALGDPPPQPDRPEQGENFGWATFFSSIERQQKMPPAALYGNDVGQLLAWVRAGAPPSLTDEIVDAG